MAAVPMRPHGLADVAVCGTDLYMMMAALVAEVVVAVLR